MPSKRITLSVVLSLCMLSGLAAGMALRPHVMVAEVRKVDLAALVPAQFGSWHEVKVTNMALVDPGTQKTLDTFYSQLLNRTYVNADGYPIMLAVAYGNDQRRGLVAHRPDVCYPAQGFTINPAEPVNLTTAFGDIPAERMFAHKNERQEPVTFWFTLGDTAVRSNLQRRLVTVRYGLTGEIADGLLFRVSSIDPDPGHAYAIQASFVRDLVASLTPAARSRLAGLQ